LRSIVFVAQYFNVNRKTVERYIASGRLPAYRLGSGPKSTIRIDMTDVENFITPAAPDEVSA